MFETLAAFATAEQLGGLTFDPPTGPALYSRTASPHRKPFATSDGYVSLMLYTDRHWAAFLSELGRDDLVGDPRLATITGRTANIDFAYSLVGDALRSRSTADWLEVLERLDVPHAPVNDIADLIDDEHLRGNGTVREYEHPTEGHLVAFRSPFLFDGRRTPDPTAAPKLGTATRDFREEVQARQPLVTNEAATDTRGRANSTDRKVHS
jgi:crotonobetainyl-CoA:carnitine CoA-transferase CaiB-like acyl-CoA transferase